MEPRVREGSTDVEFPWGKGDFAVIRVIARLNIGGPAHHVVNLTRGMADRYPTLLVFGSVGADEEDMSDLAEKAGITVFRIPELGRFIKPGQDLIALIKLIRLMRRIRPSIVHTHTAKAGTLGRIAAIVTRVPHRVHTFHGHAFHGYFHPLVTRLFLTIERTLARGTDRVIAISPLQASDLVSRYRVTSKLKVRVVPLGLELDGYGMEGARERSSFRAELGSGTLPVVSVVGRLVPVKRHDLMLSAVRILRSRGVEAVYAVVGGGPELERLQQMAEELQIADCVRFTGWRRDLVDVYAGSDVVALSSDNEGTPVAVIEAMAAGVAVVATRVGGVADVLEDGRLGILVAPGSPESLADGIERLIRDPALRQSMAALARPSVLHRYGVKRLVADMNATYDELLAKPTAESLGGRAA